MSNEKKEIIEDIGKAFNNMNDFNRGRLYERALAMAAEREDEQEKAG